MPGEPGQRFERTSVGIVVERRESRHPWQDHVWRPVAVIPGCSLQDGWRMLDCGPGWTRYYAGSLPIELFRGETEGYRQNLASTRPAVYVVLRPGQGEREFEPFLATVCPFEAQAYLESGEEIVEGVAMPPELLAWVQLFVERFSVEAPSRERTGERRSRSKKSEKAADWFARRPPVTGHDR